MRRRSRKQRKTAHRRLGETPRPGEENRFGNSFACCRGDVQNCKIKVKEPHIRGGGTNPTDVRIVQTLEILVGPSNGKQSHRLRKKKNKSPNVDWYENNQNLTFPSTTITSIAFFIPLSKCVHGLAFESTLKWNDLLYYGTNTSAMIQQYHSERRKKKCYNSCAIPRHPVKCRSSSESSANSEDSVVCFESDDSFLEDTCTYDQVDERSLSKDNFDNQEVRNCSMSNKYNLSRKSNISSDTGGTKLPPALIQSELESNWKVESFKWKAKRFLKAKSKKQKWKKKLKSQEQMFYLYRVFPFFHNCIA